MNFISKVTSGECQLCFFELGNDAIIHPDGGEFHPIHRKCLEVWMKTISNQQQTPACPICRKEINKIESPGEALIRMAKQGDDVSIKAFVKNGPFFSCYSLAISAASQNGHNKTVEALLENGSISNEFCGLALEQATENGHVETVRVLLHKRQMRYECVPNNALEKCMNIAKEKGYENIVMELQLPYQINQLFKHLSFERVNLSL
jgi:ankyrin repeat protein